MGVRTIVKDVWQRLAGVDAAAGDATMGERKTAMLPSILSPYNPAGRAGQHALPKPTAANLRKFAETPVVRRAINVVKDKIASMDWQVRVRRGYSDGVVGDAETRMKALRRCLEEPNTSQIDAKWNGDPEKPRYAQATGRVGQESLVPLLDDELMYVRLNPRTYTPFGLGRLEVAFETVNQLLSANRYAGRLASNSVVQYALWLNEATPEQHDRLIRWWQDEIEGTGRVPLLSCEQKPEVLRFAGGTDADLRLQWQETLIRMIANAFDLPPMLLGVASDVNKSTAGELADEAFESAVVPVAKLLAEHITRDLFAKKLGWREFEFCFNDLESRDEMEELQIQTTLLQAGVLTVDEVRSMRGLGPIGPARGLGPIEPAVTQ